MTFFGIIWLALIIICMIKNNPSWMIGITILSSTLQCDNVFVLGNSGVGPQIITSIAMIMKTLLYCGNVIKLRYNKMIGIQLSLIFLFFIVCFSSLLNFSLPYNILRILQLFIYIICFFCMLEMGKCIDSMFIYRLLRKLTTALLIIGFLQLGITSGYIFRLKIVQILLYNDTLSDVIYFTRNNYFRILSTYMEPSYYAGYIVGALCYFVAYRKRRKENCIIIFMLLLQMILSFSSTAYVSFCIITLAFILLFHEKRLNIFIILGGILATVFLLIFFYDILDTVIFSKLESGSAIARGYWNLAAIQNFMLSPLLGVGYKQSRASSIIFTLLGELGILGFICYCLVNIQIVFLMTKRGCNDYELKSLGLAIIGVVICQLISVPDIDICTYWMWMNIFALCISQRRYAFNNI